MAASTVRGQYPRDQITGLILAGGRSRRMGGLDKGLVRFRERRLIDHVLAAINPQVGSVLISANRNIKDYAALAHPVLQDTRPHQAGPLAGIEAGMTAATTPYLLITPCDAPLVGADLGARLFAALPDAGASPGRLAVVHDGERIQPLFCLIEVALLPSLTAYLRSGERKVDRWFETHPMACVDFSDCPERFANLNTLKELMVMERSGSP
jgi:molybdopterin-guanine dinucleotide biosynthesis protein A